MKNLIRLLPLATFVMAASISIATGASLTRRRAQKCRHLRLQRLIQRFLEQRLEQISVALPTLLTAGGLA